MNFEWEKNLKLGKVVNVYVGNPNPNKQNDKRAYCDLELSDGTSRDMVPFSSGTFDLKTGKPHGIFVAPIVGQMVGVFFVHGSTQDPVAAFPIPFDWGNETNMNIFNLSTVVWPNITNPDDIYLAHRGGSFIRLTTVGGLPKAQINDLEIDV